MGVPSLFDRADRAAEKRFDLSCGREIPRRSRTDPNGGAIDGLSDFFGAPLAKVLEVDVEESSNRRRHGFPPDCAALLRLGAPDSRPQYNRQLNGAEESACHLTITERTAYHRKSRSAAGDVLVIYWSGLGEVDPAVEAGAPAGASPLSRTVSELQVTIGGRQAPIAFSGLAPSFSGLYQVNVVMPEGASAGGSVALTMTIAGQTSIPVTIAVQ